MSIREGICPECGHAEIIATEAAEFGYKNFEDRMCVTYDQRWFHPGRNPEHGHGPLTLYTCRSCGLSQWYASNPADIPIGEDTRTRLIQGNQDT